MADSILPEGGAVPFDTLKYELAELRAAIKADITELKLELKADITDLKVDVAKLQTDTWWIKWIITGGVGLYVLRSIVEWLR